MSTVKGGGELMRRRGAFLLTLAFLALGFVGAFLARAGSPPWAPHRIYEGDSLYHYRLAQLIERSFPRVPAFDAYLDHPDGAAVPWPVLQEVVAVGVSRLAGGGAERLRAVCFFLPAVAGAACLLLVYGIARSVGVGRPAALAGAVLSTLHPIHRDYTAGGQFDHHAPDVALVLLFILALIGSWRKRGLPWRDPGALRSCAAVAATSALLPANWLGSVAYFGVLLLGASASLAPEGRCEAAGRSWLPRAAAGLAAGAVGLAALFTLAYGPGRMTLVRLDLPSAFHPLFLLAAALGLGLLGSLAGGEGRSRLRRTSPWAVALLPVTLALAPEVLRGAALYLGESERVMRTISESLSPFFASRSPVDPRFSFRAGVAALGWGALLLPVAIAWVWARRGGWWAAGKDFPRFFLTSFSLASLAAAFLQFRYGILLAPVLGFWAGVVIDALGRLVAQTGTARLRRGAALAGIGLVVATFQPGASAAARAWSRPWHRDPALQVIEDAMQWLATRTPAPSDPLDPLKPPAYGTLSPWGIGDTVIALGQRPAMATGFVGTLPGTVRALPFFLEEDPDRALAFALKNRVRYLVLENVPGALVTALYTLGEDDRCRRLVGEGYASLYREGRVPVVLRLWTSYGSLEGRDGRVFPGVRHFRLVWEGSAPPPAAGGRPRRVQIYEVVPGGRLAGTAAPGSRVWATLALDLPTQPGFLWQESAIAGAGGRWEMTLPFPTDRPSGEVTPRGLWEIRSEDRAGSLRVALPEEAVRGGGAITLP